jgi:hypothetical protein
MARETRRERYRRMETQARANRDSAPERTPLERIADDVAMIRRSVGYIAFIMAASIVLGFVAIYAARAGT